MKQENENLEYLCSVSLDLILYQKYRPSFGSKKTAKLAHI